MNVNTCLTGEIQFIVVSYYISRRWLIINFIANVFKCLI
jgi:hypothetical protein